MLDAAYLLPNSIGTSDGGRALFQRLKEIVKKEKIDLLIPTLDFELPAFIKLKHRTYPKTLFRTIRAQAI